MRDWKLEGSTLVLKHKGLDVFWNMPPGFQMPSPSLLTLAEYVLLKPHNEKTEIVPQKGPTGTRTSVAFSGGVDSAAVLKLVEDAIPIYTQVSNPTGSHKLDNALLAVEEAGGIAIVSNMDELPLLYEKRRGFFGQAGFTVTNILLAEHFDIHAFADGNIIDFVYLRSENGHGTRFGQPNYDSMMQAFAAIGKSYCMPCAGLTEVSTTKIAADYQYAMGCMRGQGGKPCLKCIKCYRKMALKGTPVETNRDVEVLLSKDWVPVLGSLLWARDNCGLSHPILDGLERDIAWVDKWYPDAMRFIPKSMREYFLKQLEFYGIESLSDDTSLRTWSSKIN